MQLILEETFDVENVVELNEATAEKTYVIKGTFSTPDKKNRNGRIYAKKLWESNVAKYQGEIKNKTQNTLMEKEHPPRTAVDPWQAVAQIRMLEMRDGVVYGEAELLNIPETATIRALIDKGIKIGVSSRGVGRMKGDIVEEFNLITYDIVSTPSDYNANLEGFNESMILEGVEIESNGKGGWICTPAGCTLEEAKDITKDVQKRLKKGPVMVMDPDGTHISIDGEDDGAFFGMDSDDNDVSISSLRGYSLVEEHQYSDECQCEACTAERQAKQERKRKGKGQGGQAGQGMGQVQESCGCKAKALIEALEAYANKGEIEEAKRKEEALREAFHKYFPEKTEE